MSLGARQHLNRRYVYSGMSQRIMLDGVSLDVVIFRPYGGGGWQLNVINQQGRATIWETDFATDWAAFDAFQNRSVKDGVTCYASNDNVVAFPHYGRRTL
ncbi:MAG TPA: hypothetical protein VF509_08915 [Sphingobium sp.]